jgi:hypothetical protein
MSQILCRLDSQLSPVVFISDSIDDNKILAWKNGNKSAEIVSLDYYKTTLPLTIADSKLLAKKYSEATGDNDIEIRQRLPRLYKQKDILQDKELKKDIDQQKIDELAHKIAKIIAEYL